MYTIQISLQPHSYLFSRLITSTPNSTLFFSVPHIPQPPSLTPSGRNPPSLISSTSISTCRRCSIRRSRAPRTTRSLTARRSSHGRRLLRATASRALQRRGVLQDTQRFEAAGERRAVYGFGAGDCGAVGRLCRCDGGHVGRCCGCAGFPGRGEGLRDGNRVWRGGNWKSETGESEWGRRR